MVYTGYAPFCKRKARLFQFMSTREIDSQNVIVVDFDVPEVTTPIH
jgi:hypothetical protein